jgi:tight adherence protein C
MFDFVISSWWIWKGVANGLVLYVTIRFLYWCFRGHTYLFSARDHDQFLAQATVVLAPYVSRLKLVKWRRWLTTNLRRAGLLEDIDVNSFITRQMMLSFAVFVGAYLLFLVFVGGGVVLPAFLAFGAWFYPAFKVNDLATRRFVSCNRDLPFFVDYLALCMDAGLDFNHGVLTVIKDGPRCPLSDELSLVMRHMRLGMSREEALNDLQRRIDTPGMKLFAQTLIQAIKIGSDIVQTLHVISDTMRSRRFQSAEEAAGKISVRMMLPMMVFVIPSTLIVLLGPIMLEWFRIN